MDASARLYENGIGIRFRGVDITSVDKLANVLHFIYNGRRSRLASITTFLQTIIPFNIL